MLIPAVTVDNLADEVDKCLLIGLVRVGKYCLRTTGTEKTVRYTEKQGVHYSGVA